MTNDFPKEFATRHTTPSVTTPQASVSLGTADKPLRSPEEIAAALLVVERDLIKDLVETTNKETP